MPSCSCLLPHQQTCSWYELCKSHHLKAARGTFPITLGMLKAMSSAYFLLCAVPKSAAVQTWVSSWDLCSCWCIWEVIPSHSLSCTFPRTWMWIQWTESQRGSKDAETGGGGESFIFLTSFIQFLVIVFWPRQGRNFTTQRAWSYLLSMVCSGAQTLSFCLFTGSSSSLTLWNCATRTPCCTPVKSWPWSWWDP